MLSLPELTKGHQLRGIVSEQRKLDFEEAVTTAQQPFRTDSTCPTLRYQALRIGRS
jgi:hypothetical protein